MGKEMRKAALSTIDVTNFIELVLKQMNYQRMKGVDLIDDIDKLVNWYLWICKKYPEPDKNPESTPAPAKAETKTVVADTPHGDESEASTKEVVAESSTPQGKKPAKKTAPKTKKPAEKKKDK